MAKYRKKPVVIDAWHFTEENRHVHMPDWLFEAMQKRTVWPGFDYENGSAPIMSIVTLEGTMTASLNDWIICGVKGELYPCKPDIFEATYDPA
jgi:hypothetical protein